MKQRFYYGGYGLQIGLLALCLSGCAGVSGQFGCHARAQRGCTPVSVINAKANAGVYQYEDSDGRVHLPSPGGPMKGRLSHRIAQKRSSHQRLAMWIAGYTDQDGQRHAPHRVSVVE